MSMRPDDHRRKWDKVEYQRKAQERLLSQAKLNDKKHEKHDVEPIERENLKRREYKVDLESKLGKSVVINKNTPGSQTGGYYCNACDCVVKDSINFLDHINGKKHQRNLGMNMQIERSTVDQVKERFQANKKKLEEKQKDYELERRLREAKEEEERYKEHRKERRKERKRKADEDLDGTAITDDMVDMAAIMGFSGFGGSKKNL
ncbi:zinc finger matrin-type protein 2 isoform X1 [Glossina fuscipes]|uniref:Zinc finger matrin-type protein 2 isoform X1 n=4 Tax=Glossina TaxID=7393 RepID=A0A9C5YZR0_9MUSC|nr:zinc finger matrin-type protein 2 isoform X1 [Glossina fuscipes]KAI9581621.1 hypothetical protein GQX74_012946 [Glossina fuscipes]